MNKSIFELINIYILRKFQCVIDYQGSNTRSAATIEHIASGIVFTLTWSIAGIIWKPMLWFVPVIWFFYAPVTEIVLDTWIRHKNPSWLAPKTLAQIIERSSGFVFALPFYVVAWFL